MPLIPSPIPPSGRTRYRSTTAAFLAAALLLPLMTSSLFSQDSVSIDTDSAASALSEAELPPDTGSDTADTSSDTTDSTVTVDSSAPPDTGVTPSLLDSLIIKESEADAIDSQSVEPIDSVGGGPVGRYLRRLGRRVGRWAPLVWLRRRFLHLLVLLASAIGIWLTASYLFGVRERKRFLTTTRLSIMDKEVQRACRYVEKNFADQSLTPSTLCEALTTGEGFLEALFERELGMTVGEFIEQVRVNRAKILLRANPVLPLSEISVATGFAESERFCSVFEKITQRSFEQYRKAIASGQEPSS